jgi:hypothetical protein
VHSRCSPPGLHQSTWTPVESTWNRWSKVKYTATSSATSFTKALRLHQQSLGFKDIGFRISHQVSQVYITVSWPKKRKSIRNQHWFPLSAVNSQHHQSFWDYHPHQYLCHHKQYLRRQYQHQPHLPTSPSRMTHQLSTSSVSPRINA